MYTQFIKIILLIFVTITFHFYTSPFFYYFLYHHESLHHHLNAFSPILSFLRRNKCLAHSKLSVLSAIELWTSPSTYIYPAWCLLCLRGLYACSPHSTEHKADNVMDGKACFTEHYQKVRWTFVSKASWVHSVLFPKTDILNM